MSACILDEICERSREREEVAMKYIQRLGKTLMLPVSIMPIAALLKGIGYWIDPTGWGIHNAVAALLIASGGAIIDNLPILFAIAVAIEMSKKRDTIVALSALACYMIMTTLLSTKCVALMLQIPEYAVDLAFYNSQSAFIGILIGLIVAVSFQKFDQKRLPQFLAFFDGKRFASIVSIGTTLVVSLIFLYIWPTCYHFFIYFGREISKLGPWSAAIYGVLNRLLIPTGLHHALNSVFWFDVAGINDIGKFWGTISGGVKGVTGMYQAGFFPVMMFGLPGAALAMYRCAKDENKKKVGAILFSAALASFFTGVTEPLEFAFMFVAPTLYLVHALLTGLMLFISASFKWIAGFGFSAGLIDYILSFKSPFANNILLLIPLGIVCGVIYYSVFRILILRYNILTPGREDNSCKEKVEVVQNDFDEIAIKLFEALGGKKNIISVDHCTTRLRVEMKDISIIDKQALSKMNFSHIVEAGEHEIQIIVGTEVQFIAEILNEILM